MENLRFVGSVIQSQDRDRDPAELWILRDDPKNAKPTGLELRYGTEPTLRLKINSWKKVPNDGAGKEKQDKAKEEA
jgi:hypothetical protein